MDLSLKKDLSSCLMFIVDFGNIDFRGITSYKRRIFVYALYVCELRDIKIKTGNTGVRSLFLEKKKLFCLYEVRDTNGIVIRCVFFFVFLTL